MDLGGGVGVGWTRGAYRSIGAMWTEDPEKSEPQLMRLPSNEPLPMTTA